MHRCPCKRYEGRFKQAYVVEGAITVCLSIEATSCPLGCRASLLDIHALYNVYGRLFQSVIVSF